MGTVIKIKSIGLTKFNNPEYCNFMTRFRGLISSTSEPEDRPEINIVLTASNTLGITDQQLTAFDADIILLNDLVNQSRISDETASMHSVNKQRNDLLVYGTSSISQMTKSPLTAQKSAAQIVYNVTKPYVGIYKSANQQETAQIQGLLTDLAKPGMPEHIKTLGLTEVFEALRDANEEYAALTAQRTNNKAASIKENSIAVRQRLSSLYDEMTTMAFVQSVSAPTAKTATFVNQLNSLISEATALYNQRIAAVNKPGKNDRPEIQ